MIYTVYTPHDAYVHAGAVIFCGEPQAEDYQFDTLLNPVVIFENLVSVCLQYV